MKCLRFALFATVLLSLCLTAWAQPVPGQQAEAASLTQQSTCSELLRHGIYDHIRQSSSNTSSTLIQAEICSAYNRLLQDKKDGKAGGTYKLFGGSASFSSEKLEIVGEMMCSNNKYEAYTDTQLTTISDTISPTAMDAYKECLRLNARGLQSTTIFREVDQRQVTIELQYVAPVGTPAQTTVNHISISPANTFTCEGPLWDLRGQKNALGTQAAAMSCTRKVATEPYPGAAGTLLLADAATITVFSETGTVNRSFAPIKKPPIPSEEPGKGPGNGPIYTTSDGKVGINIPNPAADFHLQGDMLIGGQLRAKSSGHTIIGETTSLSGGIGIYGRGTSSTGATYGMQGDTTSPDGGGVVGINLAKSGKGFGLAGEARSPQATSLVLLNDGGGDLIRGLGKNGKVVFRVTADGSVWVNDKKVLF